MKEGRCALKGKTKSQFNGEEPVDLIASYCISIQAHDKHGIERTTPDEPTTMRAVHYEPEDVDVAEGIDRTKTLQQLENDDWGEPTFDSHVVTTCHRLRRKSRSEFTVEDLRIMIGQKISLLYLIPIALERLEVDPLAGGDYYDGDLLGLVLLVDDPFWAARPDLLQRIRAVVERVKVSLFVRNEIEQQTVREVLTNGNRSLTE